MKMTLIRIVLSWLAIGHCCAGAAEFSPTPKVDGKGMIDVWQLRADLSQVEPWIAQDDTDICNSKSEDCQDCSEENDSPRPLSQRQIQRKEQQQQQALAAVRACELAVHERYADYKRMYDAFNAAWLPVLLDAARKGDKVAEVILLRCDTTPVLDRSALVSTCADAPKRELAKKRLREIGFRPAIDIESEPGFCESQQCSSLNPRGRLALQALVLDAFRYGNFATVPNEATGRWEVKSDSKLNSELDFNAGLISSALKNVSRVFRVQFGRIASTSDQSALKLNRQRFRPKQLAWGPEIIASDGALHLASTGCYSYANDVCRSLADKAAIRLLEVTETNIEKYLQEDPRWGVFLMRRDGHHEWAPWERNNVAPDNEALDPSWLGQWVLAGSAKDFMWYMSDHVGSGNAEVTQQGNTTQITIRTDKNQGAPLQDVVNCKLRYSGGLTFFPNRENIRETALGDLSTLRVATSEWQRAWLNTRGIVNGLEPLKHNKRYKQVLMQCTEGELQSNDRIRFLVLASDTLVEVASAGPLVNDTSWPIYIRHFVRPGSPAVPPVKVVKSAIPTEQHYSLQEELIPPSEANARLVRFDGLYENKRHQYGSNYVIVSYLRFYPDGRVLWTSLTNDTPQHAKNWFVPGDRSSAEGAYRIENNTVSVSFISDVCRLNLEGVINGEEIMISSSSQCSEYDYPARSVRTLDFGKALYKFVAFE